MFKFILVRLIEVTSTRPKSQVNADDWRHLENLDAKEEEEVTCGLTGVLKGRGGRGGGDRRYLGKSFSESLSLEMSDSLGGLVGGSVEGIFSVVVVEVVVLSQVLTSIGNLKTLLILR